MSQAIEPRYVLAVPDAAATSLYFQEKLGFEEWKAVGQNDWRFVRRGPINIHLGTCPGEVLAEDNGNHSWFAYWFVENADELYNEWKASGAIISVPIKSQPWGIRDFQIKTPDGHRIVVGQAI
jgi:predicted enzyme related to lactoylglutathione lyase